MDHPIQACRKTEDSVNHLPIPTLLKIHRSSSSQTRVHGGTPSSNSKAAKVKAKFGVKAEQIHGQERVTLHHSKRKGSGVVGEAVGEVTVMEAEVGLAVGVVSSGVMIEGGGSKRLCDTRRLLQYAINRTPFITDAIETLCCVSTLIRLGLKDCWSRNVCLGTHLYQSCNLTDG